MKKKRAADPRLDNASVEYLDKKIDSVALRVLVECLQEIASDFSEPPLKKQKGMRENGNIRKNTN